MPPPGNIFISRKSVASCDDCEEEDGLTTSVVYKIGKLLVFNVWLIYVLLIYVLVI